MMKALSFSQPWLWGVFDPAVDKNIENRDWQIPIDMIGAPIVAHAAKSFDDAGLHTLWELGFETPAEYTKGAIVGVFVVDRIVTSPKTLTPHQRRWYMGDEDGQRDGKTVYGHVLGKRTLLPRPIPWDGALGLWPVPPLIAAEVDAQLAGSTRTPSYVVPYAKALHDAGVASASQWAAQHPGEHLWFEHDGWPSCVCCGVIKRREPSPKSKKPPRPQKPCRGVVQIELRSVAEGG